MKSFIRSSLLALTLFFVVACQTQRAVSLREEWPLIVERARSRVLSELPNLDDVSREIIRTTEPKLLSVHIPFGNDYRFVWMISLNRSVELLAFGDYRKLDGKPVKVRENIRAR